MPKHWSQRSAWIVWIVASLFGWAAIFALFASVYDYGDKSVAGASSDADGDALRPSSGPSAVIPKP